MVYFCYVDESGTPQIPGNTSHYVLCGLSIPIKYWKKCDKDIDRIKKKYRLQDAEIHTGWIMRPYLEQSRIPDFDSMDDRMRRSEVMKIRKTEILRLQKAKNSKATKQAKKNYKHTESYIHLTYEERMNLIREIADTIGKWGFVRIFAECIDKVFFDPTKTKQTPDEQALEQLVTRFEHYMSNVDGSAEDTEIFGVLIHDNNETVSRKHTALMKRYHRQGTLYRSIPHIIETPLFVNSELTGLIQIADLCSLALRRYFENGETDLVDRIKSRFDQKRDRNDKGKSKIVGIRHFTDNTCDCFICKSTSGPTK